MNASYSLNLQNVVTKVAKYKVREHDISVEWSREEMRNKVTEIKECKSVLWLEPLYVVQTSIIPPHNLVAPLW
jgi:hypothetical protein